MWLEAGVSALVLLQMATLAILGLQQRRLQRMSGKSGNDVPGLMIANALNKIDHRLQQLEHGMQGIDRPKRSVEIHAIQMGGSANQPPMGGNYELAQLLAQDGGDPDQLMQRCGLSRSEAELMLRLHTRRA